MAQRASKAKSGEQPAASRQNTAEIAAAVEEAKLRALYQFAYGLSHEINNPLANIATRAQTLMVDEQDPERRRKLAVIVQQAFRAHEMIADLMLFANPPDMRPEPTDLAQIVESVRAELKPVATEKKIRLIKIGEAGPMMATVDRVQIAIALKAVVQNALEAVDEKGIVEVGALAAARPDSRYSVNGPHPRVPEPKLKGITRPREGLWHCLIVGDNGPGIGPEIREHIFDPYFSGREAGRGLGLGLSKAWRIVDLHGGRIEVENREGGGAEFVLMIPADDVIPAEG